MGRCCCCCCCCWDAIVSGTCATEWPRLCLTRPADRLLFVAQEEPPGHLPLCHRPPVGGVFFFIIIILCVLWKRNSSDFPSEPPVSFSFFLLPFPLLPIFFLLYPIFNLFNFFVNYSQIGPSVFSNDFFFGCLKSKRTRLIQNLKKMEIIP